VLAVNFRRLPALRATMDAGANAAVLPAMSVASLVGFGAVVAAMPAFTVVRDAVLSIGGGPLVSLAVATNVLAALTGSASGGLTIALDALGATYMARAAEIGVVTLLAVCGSTHRESYRDIVVVGIIGALLALAAVIALGSLVGSF
jgi:H+/gluconate symporter-like permease